jgi:hypothetical protein
MKRLMVAAVVVALTALAGPAQAQDPTGTWKWMTGGNQPREVTLKLKLEGDKLTGSMPGRMGQEVPIEEASYKDGEISFKVTRMRQDQKIVTKYTGKLTGDTIKGKTEGPGRDGQPQTRDWEAKRSKD